MADQTPGGDLRERIAQEIHLHCPARPYGGNCRCTALADAVMPIVEAERRRTLADLDAGRVTAEELAAAGLDPGHVVDLRDDGWTLQHPLTCRTDLFACPVNAAAVEALAEPPGMTGRYPCRLDDDGRFWIGDD